MNTELPSKGRIIADKRKQRIINFLKENYSVSSLGEINHLEKSKVIREVFHLMGRKVNRQWNYKNSKTKIPFEYIDRGEWNGVNAQQIWDKFIIGQDIQYKSLTKEEKIRYIRNILKNHYKYEEIDHLNEEIVEENRVIDTKISLFCGKHQIWNSDIRLDLIITKKNTNICRECSHEDRKEALKISKEFIIDEWNKLERIVDKDFEYINNTVPIQFFSTKFSWPAAQSWGSYQTNRTDTNPDPHDIRTLIDKRGYLNKLLAEYNNKNQTAYKIDPNWIISDNIGPKSDINLVAPEFNNFIVKMTWYDFFTL